MKHNPLVCIDDAILACELILQFTLGMKDSDYYKDV